MQIEDEAADEAVPDEAAADKKQRIQEFQFDIMRQVGHHVIMSNTPLLCRPSMQHDHALLQLCLSEKELPTPSFFASNHMRCIVHLLEALMVRARSFILMQNLTNGADQQEDSAAGDGAVATAH